MKKTFRFRKVGFIEYFGILLLLLVAAFVYVYVSPKSSDILVTLRVAEKDLIWLDNGSPRGIRASTIKEGMKEVDLFGRVVAEVVKVRSFSQPQTESVYLNKKTVYVTLRLRAQYNKQKKQYRFQGTVLQASDWLRVTIQSTIVNGVLVMVPVKELPPPHYVTLKTQIKLENPFLYEPFNETTGVDPYTADAISVGEKATDSDGFVLAEVLEKTVRPASIIVGDQYGNIFERQHPRKVDIFLTIRVAAQMIDDQLYYLDTIPLQVNLPLPLFLKNITVEPRIIEIVSIESP